MDIEKLKDAVKALKLVREQNLKLFEDNINLKNHICDLEMELIILEENS